MKHPYHIHESQIAVRKSEAKTVAEKISKALSAIGVKHSVEYTKSVGMKGWHVRFNFNTPLVGRDWKYSRINCTGCGFMLMNNMGRDQKNDKNGFPIFNAHGLVTTGKAYPQYSASFRFYGTEIRYRRRNVETIQDKTMSVYQYDDDLNAIDFAKNMEYLIPLVPKK